MNLPAKVTVMSAATVPAFTRYCGMHQLLFFGYMGSDPLKVGCQDEFLVSRLMLSFLHYWSEDSSILDALARFP